MTAMIHRARRSSSRARWTIAVLALALSATFLALWPLAAGANHPEPQLPLTADIVQGVSDCAPPAPDIGTAIPAGTTGIPPDRNNTSTSNEHTPGTVAALVIHANAESDQKELTLDISGSHNIFDGLINSRSHLKIGGSWNLMRHGTDYGLRSAGKVAFDLTGSNNCFSPQPTQTAEEAPPASPSGFPFDGAFDPDKDGNVLEHFAPGTTAATNAINHTGAINLNLDADPEFEVTFPAQPLGRYFVCGIPATGGARLAPGCSGSGASAIMDRNVQGQVIEPGLYFVTGRAKLSASNLNAMLTIVSGQQLNVNGSFQGQGFSVFRPYTDAGGAFPGTLLFASQWDEAANLSGPTFPDGSTANDSPNTDKAEDALKVEGSLSRFEGIIVATNGRNEIAGEQLDFRCPVMGDRVRVNGSKNYFNAAGCVQQPGLTVNKTPDGGVTVNAGADATFTITVTNGGGGAANNVDIDDVFPGTGWSFVGSPTGLNPNPPDNDQCSLTDVQGGTQLHCDVAVLGSGESVTIVVKRATTTADCAGDTGSGIRLDNGSLTTGPNGVSDDALADADNNPQVNDPGHLFVRCPDVKVEKTPDEPSNDINAGSVAAFTITFTNLGPGPATGVGTKGPNHDVLPAGLTWSEMSGDSAEKCQVVNNVLSCAGISLAAPNAGDTDEYSVTVSALTSAANCGQLDNLVEITADGDTNAANNTNAANIDVACPDVKVEKTPDEPNNDINAGDQATFTVKFTNLGPGPATGVGTKPPTHDVLPAGLTWTESGGDPDGKCQVVDNVLSCSGISLAAPNAGTSDEYTVSVSATTSASNCGTLNNTVEITADGDTNSANNTDSAEIDVFCPDVKVEKTPDEPNNDINAGAQATFTVKFTNLGPGAATGVGTKPPTHDPLPIGLTWTESGGDPDGKCQIALNVLSCSGISLAAPNAGTSDEYTVSVSATTSAANCGTLSNLVEITADGDTNAANNSDPGEIDVLCGAIRINKNSLKDGTAVNTYGAEFSVAGSGITGTMSVTDDDSAAAPDEDAAVGRICISGLQPGQTYTVNETKAPLGYGDAGQEDVQVTASAGDCSTANLNAATFTNPPLGEFIIDYNDLGSGETKAKIDCTGLTPDPADGTPSDFDDNIEKYTKLPGAAAPGITYSCTIVIDP